MCFLLVSRSDSDLPDSKDQKLIGNSFQFLTVRIVVFLVKLFLKFYGICQFYSRLYTQSLKLFQYFIFLLKIVSSNMLFITHTKNWWSTCKHVGNWAKKLQTKKGVMWSYFELQKWSKFKFMLFRKKTILRL